MPPRLVKVIGGEGKAMGAIALSADGRFLSPRTVFVPRSHPPGIVNVVLCPGDIDADNEVTLFDLGQMAVAFGRVAGEQHDNINADLDGDGEISLWDLGLLIEYFGMIGDD